MIIKEYYQKISELNINNQNSRLKIFDYFDENVENFTQQINELKDFYEKVILFTCFFSIIIII